MLIGFLGAPCSGKSTTAARLFADFKELATPAEFISERARIYIATKRNQAALDGSELVLSDQDQFRIAYDQATHEATMVNACGSDVLVITDTSVLNSILYMTKEFQLFPQVQDLINESLARYDLIFLCAPVPKFSAYDPNRIHDRVESAAINILAEELVFKYGTQKPFVLLSGSPHLRLATAYSHVMNFRDAAKPEEVDPS